MSSFSDWSRSGLGRSLHDYEQNALSRFLPALKGDIAVQYGYAGTSSLLETCNIKHKFLLLASENHEADTISASSFEDLQPLHIDPGSTLPFLSSSVDLCLLPHMLDFSDNPHQLLRESKDILVSGGHLVILGFNPYSLWGVRKYISKANVPWNGLNASVYKVRDWLSLLDFHVCGGMMLYYSPPIKNKQLREKFVFMENAGDRWWPMLGGVYLLIAQKREAGMTVIDLGAKVRKRAFLSVAEPVSKTSIK
jgi:SAM-dependent methyltransferase